MKAVSGHDPGALGIFYATIAYVSWGCAPLFWAFFTHVSAEEIWAQRGLWSFVFLLPLGLANAKRQEFYRIICQRRYCFLLTISALLIACSWYLFIVAMVTNRVLESSLGYFLTPLATVLVGLCLLGERLRRAQWVAVVIASIAVGILWSQLDEPPWLAISMAGAFSLYGYFKKITPVSGDVGMLVEIMILIPFFLIYLSVKGVPDHSAGTWALFLVSGPVTILPLVWYALAVERTAYFIVGFLQYISPVLQFTIAVFMLGETFSLAHQISFALTGVALGIFTWDLVRSL